MTRNPRKKTGLGRGISALIPDLDMDDPESSSDFFMCPVSEIAPNRYQPRTVFDEEELERLQESIARQGVLQPLLVRHMDGAYELIAGERRLRAARAAGRERVPVLIKDLSDEQVLEVSIIENIQRQQLNVLEEAEAYFRLIDEFHYTQDKVARKIGKNRSTIANLLRLRGLPEPIKDGLLAKKISMGHARALLGCPTETQQLDLFDRVLSRGLSVRKTEQLVKQAKEPPKETDTDQPEDEETQFLANTATHISRHIQSPVTIRKKGSRGRIEINFTSQEEFQRLVDLLGRMT